MENSAGFDPMGPKEGVGGGPKDISPQDSKSLSYGGDAIAGVYHIGGAVSAPVPAKQVVAEYSEEARAAHYEGICLVSVIVDAQGNPQNVHVSRSLGKGLDEKAVEAVRKWKFKPAMKGNMPVPVFITVEVNFRLYDKR